MIPALILFCVLLFMLVSKGVLFFVQKIAKYYFELLTQRDAKDIIPFTLLASAADVVLIIINTAISLIHWLNKVT